MISSNPVPRNATAAENNVYIFHFIYIFSVILGMLMEHWSGERIDVTGNDDGVNATDFFFSFFFFYQSIKIESDTKGCTTDI